MKFHLPDFLLPSLFSYTTLEYVYLELRHSIDWFASRTGGDIFSSHDIYFSEGNKLPGPQNINLKIQNAAAVILDHNCKIADSHQIEVS